MSKRVRRRRGTRAEHDEFTGADGEITVNTTDYRVHVHDGATAGGIVTAREDEVLHKDQNLSDVDSAATSRTNLELGTAATKSANQNLRTTDDVTFGSVSAGNLGTAAEREANQDLRTTDDVNFIVLRENGNRVGPVETSDPIDLGGDFDANQFVVCSRRGDVVTITGDGGLSHSSGTSASSGNPIPSQFRPTLPVHALIAFGGDFVEMAVVDNFGVITAAYRNWSGSFTSRDGLTALSITYVIT